MYITVCSKHFSAGCSGAPIARLFIFKMQSSVGTAGPDVFTTVLRFSKCFCVILDSRTFVLSASTEGGRRLDPEALLPDWGPWAGGSGVTWELVRNTARPPSPDVLAHTRGLSAPLHHSAGGENKTRSRPQDRNTKQADRQGPGPAAVTEHSAEGPGGPRGGCAGKAEAAWSRPRTSHKRGKPLLRASLPECSAPARPGEKHQQCTVWAPRPLHTTGKEAASPPL